MTTQQELIAAKEREINAIQIEKQIPVLRTILQKKNEALNQAQVHLIQFKQAFGAVQELIRRGMILSGHDRSDSPLHPP